MATKTFQTRIQLKYDTLENWNASTFIPKAGELCIAAVPADTAPPATIAKCGDGTNKFSDLPWMQAVASDIYDWAKSATKPTYTANEISGLQAYIAGKVQDTDTNYQLLKVDNYTYKLQSKSLDATTWTDVSTLTIPNTSSDIAALQELVGETSVAGQISSAIGALDVTKVTAGTGKVIDSVAQTDGKIAATTRSLVKGDIPTIDQSQVSGLTNALAAKQPTLSFDGTYSSSNKAATVSTVTNAINNLDKSDTAVAGQVVSSVSQTNGVISVSRRALAASDIPTIAQSQVTNLSSDLAAKQPTLSWMSDNYDAASNPAVTKSDLQAAVADLSGAMHFKGVVDELPTSANPGDIYIVGSKEYVYSDGFEELGDQSSHAIKGAIKNADIASDAAIAQSKIAGLADSLAAKANTADLGTMAAETAANYVKKSEAPGYADILTKTSASSTYETKTDAASKLSSAKSYADGLVNALDVTAVTAGTGAVVDSVSQTNGKIAVTTRTLTKGDIPTIDQSQVSGLSSALAGKQASLSFDGTYNSSSNKAATVSSITNKIAALDKADAAVANQFVTVVSETDGIISVSRAQPNINGIAQTSGDTLILDCGSSTINI